MGGESKLTGPQSVLTLAGALVHRIAITVLSAQTVTMDAANSTSSYNESINQFTVLPRVVGVAEVFLAWRIGYGA